MTFLTPIVISEKIQYKNSLLKFKSFTASFSVHATVFGALLYFVSNHPIPIMPVKEKITISLADFTSSDGDINRIENPVSPKKNIVAKPKQNTKTKESVEPIKQTPYTVTTPERTPSLTPSVSPEASAPLAVPHAAPSVPPTKIENDSPHLTMSNSEKELPRNPISDNQLGGAALGHIHAMIEHALTYPTIARKLRLEGIVLVTFTLNPNGTVDIAQIKSTSGSTVLDKKAIQTILSLSGDYPALGNTFELSIPIVFSLQKS